MDRSPFDAVKAGLCACVLSLTACGPDGIVPQPVPIALSYVLKPGDQIVCVETLTRISLPAMVPFFGWAKRTFTCELYRITPYERVMREK